MRRTLCLASGVLNESLVLEKFFKHHSWVDEIIVLDSGSKDNPESICRLYKRKLFLCPLNGNCNGRANWVLSQAKSDWIFFIDPDEFISEQLKKEILLVLNNPQCEFSAFEFLRVNHFMNKPLRRGGWSGYSLKMFRKERVEFKGDSYHENPVVNGKVGRLRGEVLHYPNPNIHWIMEKFNYISEFDLQGYFNRYGVLSPGRFKRLLLTRPLKNFWKCYFKKQGYKDGLHGFIYAMLIWAQDVIRICKYGEKFIIKNPNLMAQEKLPDPWECRKK